jgi:hypothetical protein
VAARNWVSASVKRGLADEALALQLAVRVGFGAGIGQQRIGLRHAGVGGSQAGLGAAFVDARQHAARCARGRRP